MIKYSLVTNKKNKEVLKPIFDKTCLLISKNLKIKDNLYFDCSFVSLKKIHQINLSYRHIDKPTDVISFAFHDNQELITPLLGEIFICEPIAKIQAKDNKHSLNYELAFLFIHGLLHLLGYDHLNHNDEKMMFKIQNQIINQLITLKLI